LRRARPYRHTAEDQEEQRHDENESHSMPSESDRYSFPTNGRSVREASHFALRGRYHKDAQAAPANRSCVRTE
jgi:hypothetical protein